MADPVSPRRRPSRRRVVEFAETRLRRSVVLQACAALAFLEYGGLTFIAAFGKTLRPEFFKAGLNFSLAGWLALCSLGSWFFLFRWFPFLQTLQAKDTGDGSALALGRILEAFAIGCVLVVHVVLAMVIAVAF